MSQLWQQISALAWNIIYRPDIGTIFDIVIVTIVLYFLIKLTQETRAVSVMKGVAILLVVAFLSSILGLRTLNFITRQLLNTGTIMFVVLFQPELRKVLEQLGRGSLFKKSSRQLDKVTDTPQLISELVKGLTSLAKRKVGALIVIERNTGLKDIIETGTAIDGYISASLIENIFEPNTPLHDGAVVIRADRIMAAGCILPLSDEKSISRELGTRHRAAIGTSDTTDALTFIVSEETGIISMTREGKLLRYLDHNSITKVLSEVYINKEESLLETFLKRRLKNEKSN